MNSDFPTRLTAQLRANPLYFEEMDEILLSELVCHYYEGKLDSDDAAEVEALLKTDSNAKEIYERLQAADRFAATSEGQAWLENLPARALASQRLSSPVAPAPAFFIRLAEWLNFEMPKFRRELSLQGGFSEGSPKDVEKEFPSDSGDPYQASLVRDSLGRWFLRVFTTDAAAAKLKLRLEIAPEQPEMKFVAVEPALFFAEVRLSEKMALALNSGHRPVFHKQE